MTKQIFVNESNKIRIVMRHIRIRIRIMLIRMRLIIISIRRIIRQLVIMRILYVECY